jgi:hypothetical protein
MDSRHYIPNIYADPRTIYTQPPTLYDSPQRPQPFAAGVQSEPTSTPIHRQSLVTQTTQTPLLGLPMVRPSRRSVADDAAIGNVVYQSLQRPKLLRGGEWQLAVATNLTAAAFVISSP